MQSFLASLASINSIARIVCGCFESKAFLSDSSRLSENYEAVATATVTSDLEFLFSCIECELCKASEMCFDRSGDASVPTPRFTSVEGATDAE